MKTNRSQKIGAAVIAIFLTLSLLLTMVPAFVLFNQEESDTGGQEVTVTPAVTEEGSDNSTEGVEVTVTPEKENTSGKGVVGGVTVTPVTE